MDRFQKWYPKHRNKLQWWFVTDVFEGKDILVLFTDDEDNMDGVQDVIVIQRRKKIQHIKAVLTGRQAARGWLQQHGFKGLRQWDQQKVQAVERWILLQVE